MNKTPNGITPPTPGLDHEEPDFWIEDDIPTDDRGARPAAQSEERTSDKPERE